MAQNTDNFLENANFKDEIAIISFYSFTNIEELESLLPKILLIGKRKYVKGTVLISSEGFNGSLSGAKENVYAVLNEITKLTNAKDINIKVNYANAHVFSRLKVKIKKEIITMGYQNLDIQNLKGEYIEPREWDNFIKHEDVVLIDTRNDYEVEAGTFKGAVDPHIKTFRDFPKWMEDNREIIEGKKVAMFCTGGIRCEKSTALLKSMGHNEVYHLKGGILQYLEDTKNQTKAWTGECFVFDDRRLVAENLKPADLKPAS